MDFNIYELSIIQILNDNLKEKFFNKFNNVIPVIDFQRVYLEISLLTLYDKHRLNATLAYYTTPCLFEVERRRRRRP